MNSDIVSNFKRVVPYFYCSTFTFFTGTDCSLLNQTRTPEEAPGKNARRSTGEERQKKHRGRTPEEAPGKNTRRSTGEERQKKHRGRTPNIYSELQ